MVDFLTGTSKPLMKIFKKKTQIFLVIQLSKVVTFSKFDNIFITELQKFQLPQSNFFSPKVVCDQRNFTDFT